MKTVDRFQLPEGCINFEANQYPCYDLPLGEGVTRGSITHYEHWTTNELMIGNAGHTYFDTGHSLGGEVCISLEPIAEYLEVSISELTSMIGGVGQVKPAAFPMAKEDEWFLLEVASTRLVLRTLIDQGTDRAKSLYEEIMQRILSKGEVQRPVRIENVDGSIHSPVDVDENGKDADGNLYVHGDENYSLQYLHGTGLTNKATYVRYRDELDEIEWVDEAYQIIKTNDNAVWPVKLEGRSTSFGITSEQARLVLSGFGRVKKTLAFASGALIMMETFDPSVPSSDPKAEIDSLFRKPEVAA